MAPSSTAGPDERLASLRKVWRCGFWDVWGSGLLTVTTAVVHPEEMAPASAAGANERLAALRKVGTRGMSKVWGDSVGDRAVGVRLRGEFHWTNAAGAKCVHSPQKSHSSPAISSFRGW
eukprot:358530-Chlamydomonas_euryale.AAC.4